VGNVPLLVGIVNWDVRIEIGFQGREFIPRLGNLSGPNRGWHREDKWSWDSLESKGCRRC
jgi:hypothetical protein